MAPDFRNFDPVQAGMLPPGTSRTSVEYFGAHRYLIRDYFLEQVSQITEIPRRELSRTLTLATPRIVSVVERIGRDALVAPNCVIAGDSFGNSSFLLSGGASTGMVGHAARVYRYWQAREAGVDHAEAVRQLADGIRGEMDPAPAPMAQAMADVPAIPDDGSGGRDSGRRVIHPDGRAGGPGRRSPHDDRGRAGVGTAPVRDVVAVVRCQSSPR